MKKIKNIIIKFFTNKYVRFGYLSKIGLFDLLSDERYIKMEYKCKFGKKLNLSEPKTFNEKIQWLKINDRKDHYSKMVDKYAAKKYVSRIIGEKYIIPTLGIYSNFDEIDFDILPSQFVIKCTHDSGGVVIVKDKNQLDKNSIRKKINKFLKRKYYYVHREWPYKNVKPRIIVEEYLKNDDGGKIKDYKFFCFNGKPKIMYISEGLDNHSDAKMSFFDMDFNLIKCRRKNYKPLDYKPIKPINFKKMKHFASLLSKNIPHIRVDFYEINGKLYFGELTFSTGAGLIEFENEEWDNKLGELIDLSVVKRNEK